MKQGLSDIVWFIDHALRYFFYLGTGLYLGMKALVMIPDTSLPEFLAIPALIIAIGGGLLLARMVLEEPTPQKAREAKKKAEFNQRLLDDIAKKGLNGGM